MMVQFNEQNKKLDIRLLMFIPGYLPIVSHSIGWERTSIKTDDQGSEIIPWADHDQMAFYSEI